MIALLRRYGVSLLAGVLLACAFPQSHCYPLAWIALAPLLFRAARMSPFQASLQFFAAGWIFNSIVLQWLLSNILWGGGWAVIGYQLLCIGLSLFWALLGFVWVLARRRSTRFAGATCLAALWVAMEWVQANLFGGFGWAALAYSQGADLVFAQWAAVGSVSLVSFLLVLVNGLLALSMVEREGRWLRLGGAAFIVVIAHGGGALLLGEAEYPERSFRAGIYQSDYSQEMKWDWDFAAEMVEMAAYQSERLSQFERVDCFFWPEALLVDHYEIAAMLDPVVRLATATGVPVFTGAVRREDGPVEGAAARKIYNSSVLVGADGEVKGHYDKVHLAPFGEYMPFDTLFPFLRQIVPMDVGAGSEQRVLDTGKRTIGPLICFEVLFGPMAENLRRMGADVLVVVTNLAWFGGSSALPQELEMARMRAIETRLPLVQSANTGISGVFDPYGRFAPVNAVLLPSGRYAKWENEPIDPRSVIMQRRLGALLVAEPGRRPVPFGPVVFPWLAMAAALLLLLLAMALPGAKAHEKAAAEPSGGAEADETDAAPVT